MEENWVVYRPESQVRGGVVFYWLNFFRGCDLLREGISKVVKVRNAKGLWRTQCRVGMLLDGRCR